MEKHIVIDKNRDIIVPDELKRIAVQYDHNVETVTFDCPRYWDGNDLSKMTIYVNYSNKMNQTPGAHPVTNVCIDSEDEELLHFDWVISRNVTEKKGSLIIMVCAKLVDDEDHELQHWNSETNSEMYISEALRAGTETVVEAYPDTITGMYTRISENEKEISSLDGRVSKLEETGPYIDPVFANNSWELIKWVCQTDDPSKYWKVGDYKDLSFGEDKLIATNLIPDTAGYYHEMGFLQEMEHGNVLYFEDWDKFCAAIGNEPGTYSIVCPYTDIHQEPYIVMKEGKEICRDTTDNLGVKTSDSTIGPSEWVVDISRVGYGAYPLQIVGFNHDKVTDPYNYGKQKAGMTLQLGCSRSQYGDTKASLYSGTIEGLMTPNGYFYSPTRVRKDYSLGATNWADGGFRIALQDIFKDTEIEPFMVEVQKFTSQFYYESNTWEAPMLTKDKVFLMSENEMFGKQHQAPAQEGDHYEFYKDGYSKFMWHDDLLNGTTDNALIWLRSAQKSQVNENVRDSISACCCYLTVNSRDPLNVNYAPSAAGNVSEVRAGFIAPCICL